MKNLQFVVTVAILLFAPTLAQSLDKRRIALVTMASVAGDIQKNAEKIERYMQQASEKGVQLILFPELSLTANFPGAGDAAIERNSPILLGLAKKAEKLGLAVSVGFPEKCGDKIYVAQAFLHHGEVKSVYRKIFCCEEWGNDGENFEIVDWDGVKVGTIICFDLHFPEASRGYGKRGADMILFPAAYDSGADGALSLENHNVYLGLARAKENSVFFFEVNCSTDPSNNDKSRGKVSKGNGHVLAVSPNGKILWHSADSYNEQMVILDIDIVEARKTEHSRKHIPQVVKRIGLLEKVPASK